MEPVLSSPATSVVFGIPAITFAVAIPIAGLLVFAWILSRRIRVLCEAAPDPRLDRIKERIWAVVKFALLQYRQPRYPLAGTIHILIFAGFVILSLRSLTLVLQGIVDGFVLPGMGGVTGNLYIHLKDVAATVVLAACIIAIVRRGIFKPERYAVPPQYGKAHTGEALAVLLMISGLMICDMFFDGSLAAAHIGPEGKGAAGVPGTGAWLAAGILLGATPSTLQGIHLGAYFLHDLIFFFFLCFLPLGKHFHVITSFPNAFFSKLDRGAVKPVRWEVDDADLLDLDSCGVKRIQDFTWKHILDFYSCADCGRCSDQCPANAVGRPLSPRFLSIKCRDYCFETYPLAGGKSEATDQKPLIGDVLEPEEIWSCTTCGACEAECPLLIEYIDKIVDLRRGLIDEGMVPQTLQKPLMSLEKRGNPYGKMEKRRADWIKELGEDVPVKILDKRERADVLYFTDSITAYDDRIQDIARSTARVLNAAGIDFGILGRLERDSGHEVRRFGEELLFMDLREANTQAILNSGAKRLVTSDPHAFNALKNDYAGIPQVEHTSQVLARCIRSQSLRFNPLENPDAVFTYHDSCYLGRHNGIYDAPREVLDAIPGLKRAEMARCRDRSFCCGGGGLNLFYEPVEDKRMAQVRIDMAREAGADVIVTACPFCLVHFEDGIKTMGLEGKMEVIDLVELVDRQLQRREVGGLVTRDQRSEIRGRMTEDRDQQSLHSFQWPMLAMLECWFQNRRISCSVISK